MPHAEILNYVIDGFQAVGLRTPHVEVRVLPALGAKIINLVDRRTGREWLWRKPGQHPLARNRPHDPFELGPMAGVDECLPTVAPCETLGRHLPDHGEVWSAPWQLDETRLGRGEIRTLVQLPLSPLRFERTIWLRDNRLHLRYELTNLSDGPEPYLWAFHPLLATAAGDRIEIPGEISEVVVDSSAKLGAHRGDRLAWPAPKPGVNLADIDLGADGSYLKCFASPLSTGRASIHNPQTNRSLTLEFDPADLPALGVWITRGGWNGYHHVALEPTNVPAETLSAAARHALCRPLPPRATRGWSLTLTLGS